MYEFHSDTCQPSRFQAIYLYLIARFVLPWIIARFVLPNTTLLVEVPCPLFLRSELATTLQLQPDTTYSNDSPRSVGLTLRISNLYLLIQPNTPFLAYGLQTYRTEGSFMALCFFIYLLVYAELALLTSFFLQSQLWFEQIPFFLCFEFPGEWGFATFCLHCFHFHFSYTDESRFSPVEYYSELLHIEKPEKPVTLLHSLYQIETSSNTRSCLSSART